MPNNSIAVLGGGSWGTALALHLANHGQSVDLWEFVKDQAESMRRDRENKAYLPGISFPASFQVSNDLAKVLKGKKDILIVVPSHAFRQTLVSMKPHLEPDARIAWATKGLDPKTNQLLHELVIEILGERKMAVISGPSFAKEVAAGLPTAICVASNDETFMRELAERFNRGQFRMYLSSDMIGVQLGGAVKNVIALAAGASDGLGFGSNARCGLITRGLAEVTRLGLAMGAKQETFMGLSGLGDLVLTCTDDQSRNRRFGLALAQNMSLEEAKASIGQVVEGIHTVDQVMALAKQYQIEMPICDAVWRVLQRKISPKDAVTELLSRPVRSE